MRLLIQAGARESRAWGAPVRFWSYLKSNGNPLKGFKQRGGIIRFAFLKRSLRSVCRTCWRGARKKARLKDQRRNYISLDKGDSCRGRDGLDLQTLLRKHG